MAILDPLKVVIDNYPDDMTEEMEMEYHPEHPEYGTRKMPFSKEIYIERADFMKEPVKKYFRMFPGNEVRLIKAYFVKCVGWDEDENGNVTCVHCTYDPESRGGNSPDGRKVKGTIHWVDAKENAKAQARIYDRLFNVENPSDESTVGDFEKNLNPDSLVEKEIIVEKAIASSEHGKTYQFMRNGYFCVDTDSTEDKLIFNRTVALRDSFKINK